MAASNLRSGGTATFALDAASRLSIAIAPERFGRSNANRRVRWGERSANSSAFSDPSSLPSRRSWALASKLLAPGYAATSHPAEVP
jgi:hypothetical protein